MMATPCHFHKDWFAHPEWWFSKDNTYDIWIAETYEHLLFDSALIESNAPITSIIVYDQLPRHMYRTESANHIIEFYLQKALTFLHTYLDTDYERQLSAQEWTFFMLPLRHTKVSKNILYVIERTWQRIEHDPHNSDTYKRFLKATYTNALNILHHMDNHINISCENFHALLAFTPQEYNHPTNPIKDVHLINANFLSDIDTTKTVIISLSGGVDSMVCSFALKHFLSPQTRIIAVHINYDNRPQCAIEAAFLQHWCAHLGIQLHVRTIKEIHRALCMRHELRDLYERYTRDVRYLSYKSVSNNHNFQVILGHNRDDCYENIMTNIAQKNKYENLTGMSSISVQDAITFVRPLLKISKQNIIDFAQSNNIPYLPNSTPPWSQRGQIRNAIVPCLDKWDTRFVPSMFELSSTMTDLYDILALSVSQFIAKGTFDKSRMTFKLEELPISELCTTSIFWKEFFRQVFNYSVSKKSLHNLTECIQTLKQKQNSFTRKIMIAKDISFRITHTSIFIMKCPGPSLS